jgi:hypothetical protein
VSNPTRKTLYFDESGFSGYNLLDKAQPIFTVASADVAPDEAERILKVSVLPHVILLPVASSAMLPEGAFPSPSHLIVSCKAVDRFDAAGGRSRG